MKFKQFSFLFHFKSSLYAEKFYTISPTFKCLKKNGLKQNIKGRTLNKRIIIIIICVYKVCRPSVFPNNTLFT